MSVREELAAYIRNAENDGDKLRYLYESTCGDHGSFRSQWLAIVQAIADAHRPAAEPELPAIGDVWGNPVDPLNWRVVHFVASGSVQYAEVGNSDILSTMSDSWHEWIAKTGAVNITAKLREATP